MITYRFQVIQTSKNPSLAIFMLLSSPQYIESKWNLHWWEAKPRTLWWKTPRKPTPVMKNAFRKLLSIYVFSYFPFGF